MVIRPQQMEKLSDYMYQRFVDRMVAYLRSRFAKETSNVTNDELRQTVKVGIDRAERHGVTDESDVRRYLEYVMSYGANFDESDWAAPILNQSASGVAKMNELEDYCICRVSGSEPA